MAGEKSLNTDELLAQADWLRRLARSMVPDPAQADDLVQDTLLAALQNPPGREGSLRAWLVAVVRNFVRQGRRSEDHRRGREMQAASSEVQPATDDLLQEIEAQALIAKQVTQLGEPYRSVLLLRYYRGLSPSAIAEQQGVPAGTVRSQLTRAKAMLHERLVEDGHDSQAFLSIAAGIVSTTRANPMPLAALPTTQLVFMNIAAKISIAAGLTGLAFVGWRQFPSQPEAIQAEMPDEEAPVLLAGEAGLQAEFDGHEVHPSDDALPSRVSVPAAPVEEPVTPTTAIQDTIEAASLSAVFVDGEGLPLPGIRLSVRDGDWGGSKGEVAVSDHAGAATIQVELETLGSSRVLAQWAGVGHRAGLRKIMLRPGDQRVLGTIEVLQGASAAGRIVDEGGRPIPGVHVYASQDAVDVLQDLDLEAATTERLLGELERTGQVGFPREFHIPAVTESDENGDYSLEGIAPGEACCIWAWKEGWRYAWSAVQVFDPNEHRPGLDLTMELLDDEDRIAGLVVLPDGEVASGALLSFQMTAQALSMTSSFHVDDSGRFDLVLRRKVPHTLTASMPGSNFAPASAADVQPGTTDLILKLGVEENGTLLSVRDQQGEPLETYTVRLRTLHEGGSFSNNVGGGEHENGELWIAHQPQTFEIDISSEGYAVQTLGPFQDGHVPSKEIRVVMASVPSLSGRVFQNGRAVPNAEVQLHEVVDDRVFFAVNGFPSRLKLAQHSTQTAADGTFDLFPSQSGTFVLRASSSDLGSFESEPFWADASTGSKGHQLNLEAPGRLRIRVERSDGSIASGVTIAVHRYDSHPRTHVTDSNGKVVLESQSPGGWRIVEAEDEIDGNARGTASGTRGGSGPIEWHYDAFVRSGETTNYVLRLDP